MSSPPGILECELYAEQAALKAVADNDVYFKHYGKRFPASEREAQILRTIANTMHWVARDPDGFKAFAARLKVKFGPIDSSRFEMTDKQKEAVALAAGFYDEIGDVGAVAKVTVNE